MPSNVARSARQNGEAVRTIRTMRGLSREDVAERADSSYSHIANIETEAKAVSVELIHRIAIALDVPVAALLREPIHSVVAVPA